MGLAVDDAGGSGRPVVCLPMLGMSRGGTAMAFSPALGGWSGLREVYLDLPGHGDSPGEGAADSQTVLDTLCEWLERHLQRPALMAGASYGAYLAAGIARQRPDLVDGLLLVCLACGSACRSVTCPWTSRRSPSRAGWTRFPPSCTATWTVPLVSGAETWSPRCCRRSASGPGR